MKAPNEKRFDDQRIAYGVRCTWWGSIWDVSTTSGARGMRLPCCPRCGGMLFEVRDIGEWNASVARYAREKNDPEYPVLMAWARGKCFRNHEELVAAWKQQQAGAPS